MVKRNKEERVEAWLCGLRKRWEGASIDLIARYAIAEQDRREGPLVAAMRDAMRLMSTASWPTGHEALSRAIAAWESLDAKPEPTLLAAAKAITTPQPFGKTISGVLVDGVMWEALKAAVERVEAK